MLLFMVTGAHDLLNVCHNIIDKILKLVIDVSILHSLQVHITRSDIVVT